MDVEMQYENEGMDIESQNSVESPFMKYWASSLSPIGN